MNTKRLRILAAGFTEEEYRLYRFEQLEDPEQAVDYLSNRLNNALFRPRLNGSAQKHVREDKWIAQLYFSALGLPVAPLIGLWHPRFGCTADGRLLPTQQALREVITHEQPARLVFKPRGGRQGRHIHVVSLTYADGVLQSVTHDDRTMDFDTFLGSLPGNAFGDYDGGYHGWLVQHHVTQHAFMLELAPYAVNTCRVITFVDATGSARVQFAALRLGRRGSVADNWDKGGISVHIDVATGRLGRGVFKPSFGGQWVDAHPDTGATLVGREIPHWREVVAVCNRAALALSGVRSIGWDIALSPEGPIILEGNADWSLPLVQVHTRGLLTTVVRAELAACGAVFPNRLPDLSPAVLRFLWLQGKRTRVGQAVARLRMRLRQLRLA